MARPAEVHRYRFGPLERRGFIAGIRLGQLPAIVAGVAGALAMLRLLGSGVIGGGAALFCLGVALAVALLPIGSRTLDQWAPVALGFAARGLRGGRRWDSEVHLAGHVMRVRREANLLEVPEVRPRSLRTLRMLAAPVAGGGGELGVVKDAADSTYTAVLSVAGRGFALLDEAEKARCQAAWAGILAAYGLESSAVRRLQWVERAVPEDADVVRRYARERAYLGQDDALRQSYESLVERTGLSAQQHEVLVALQLDGKRAWKHIRRAGRGDADRGACEVLVGLLTSLQVQLQSADLSVVGALTPTLYARSIRVAYDPAARQRRARIVDAGGREGVHPAQAWPTHTDERFSSYRSDSGWHATYHVREWPRLEVGPSFLQPLLLQTRSMRTVAMTMEALPPGASAREVEQARIADESDQAIRSRWGFRDTSRKRKERETVARVEDEVAEGEISYRFSAYITVSAPDAEGLEAACGETERQAAQSRLELERLHGQQEVAFTYTLPLGRGLR